MGSNHTQQFIIKFWYLPDIPITLCVVSVMAMLISGLIAVGGIYSDGVWWYALILGLIMLIGTLLVYFAAGQYASSAVEKDHVNQQSNDNNNNVVSRTASKDADIGV